MAAWRPGSRQRPRPLKRANVALHAARVARDGGSGTLSRRLGSGGAASFVVSVPASPFRRGRSRPSRSVARFRRHGRSHGGHRHMRGPRSSTSPLAEMKQSSATAPAGPGGSPSPALAGRPSTAGTAPEAGTGDPLGPAAVPRESNASTLAGSAEWAQWAGAPESSAGAACDIRGGLSWRDDYSGAAGDGPGDKWAPVLGGGVATTRHDREDRWRGGRCRLADARDGRAGPAAGPRDGRGHATTGRDGLV